MRVAPGGAEFNEVGAVKTFGVTPDRAALTNDLVLLPVGLDGIVQIQNNNGTINRLSISRNSQIMPPR